LKSPRLAQRLTEHTIGRPEISLDIRNLKNEQDVANADFKSPGKARREDLATLGKVLTERVKQQSEIAEQRSIRRFSRAKQMEQQHNDFVKSLLQYPRPTHLDLKTIVRAGKADQMEERTRNAERTAQLLEKEAESLEKIRDYLSNSPRK
jgi:predicted transcriptional regulator